MTDPVPPRRSRWLAILAAIVLGGTFLFSPFGLPLLLPFLWLAGVLLSGALVLLALSSMQAVVGSLAIVSWQSLMALLGFKSQDSDGPQPLDVTPQASQPGTKADNSESPRHR